MSDNNVKIRVSYDVSDSERDADAFFGKFGSTGVYNRNINEAKSQLKAMGEATEALARSFGVSTAAADVMLRRAIQNAKEETRVLEREYRERQQMLEQWISSSTTAQSQYMSSLLRQEKATNAEMLAEARKRAAESQRMEKQSTADWEKEQREKAAAYRKELDREEKAHAQSIQDRKKEDREYNDWYTRSWAETQRKMVGAYREYGRTVRQVNRDIMRDNEDVLKRMQATVDGTDRRVAGIQVPRAAEGKSKGFLTGLAYGSPVAGTLLDAGVAGLGFAGGMAAASMIGRLTGLLREGTSAWFEYSKSVEQTTVGMKTLLGSQGQAEDLINKLKYFAATTPFNFQSAAAAGRRLLGANYNKDQVVPLLDVFGDAVSAFGGTEENFSRVIENITKIKNLGRVQRLDLRQFARNFVPAQSILSSGLDMSPKEVEEMVRRGEMSSELFVDGFVRAMAKRPMLREAMTAASRETFEGAFSNLEDAVLIAANKSFKPFYDGLRELVVKVGDSFLSADGMLGIAYRTFDLIGQGVGNLASTIASGIKGALSPSNLISNVSSIGTTPALSLSNYYYNRFKADEGTPQERLQAELNLQQIRRSSSVWSFVEGIRDSVSAKSPEYIKAEQIFKERDAANTTINSRAFVPFVNSLTAEKVNPYEVRLQAHALAQASKGNKSATDFFDSIILKKDMTAADIQAYRKKVREMYPNAEEEAKNSKDAISLMAWEKLVPGAKAELLGAQNEAEDERMRKAEERFSNSLVNKLIRARQEAKEFFKEMTGGYSQLAEIARLNRINSVQRSIVEKSADLGVDIPNLPGIEGDLNAKLKYYKDYLRLLEDVEKVKSSSTDSDERAKQVAVEFASFIRGQLVPAQSLELTIMRDKVKAVQDRKKAEMDLYAGLIQAQEEYNRTFSSEARTDAFASYVKDVYSEATRSLQDSYKVQFESALQSGTSGELISDLQERMRLIASEQPKNEMQKITDYVSQILDIMQRSDKAQNAGISSIQITGSGYELKSGGSYKDILEFGKQFGFAPASSSNIYTTGGKHGKNSAHYDSRAVDFRTKNHSRAEGDAFIERLWEAGYFVVDERDTKSPHIHAQIGTKGVSSSYVKKMMEQRAAWGGKSVALPGSESLAPVNPAPNLGALSQFMLSGSLMGAIGALTGIPGIRAATQVRNENTRRDRAVLDSGESLRQSKLEYQFYSGDPRARRILGEERESATYQRKTEYIKEGNRQLIELDAAQERYNRTVEAGEEYQTRFMRSLESRRVTEYADALEASYEAQVKLAQVDSAENRKLIALKTETEILNDQVKLREENYSLELRMASASVGIQDRYRNTALRTIQEIQRRDEDANHSMIKSRLELADAQIFHSDRAKAAVLDHLSKQQSITEATASAQIKIYEGIAGSLDRGIDKITRKLGFFGDAIADVMKAVTRGILTRAISPLFGLGGGAGGAAQVGAAGILPSILGAVTGGGAGGGVGGIQIPGIGVGGTAPFAGGGGNIVGSVLGKLVGSGSGSIGLDWRTASDLIGPQSIPTLTGGVVSGGSGRMGILSSLSGLFNFNGLKGLSAGKGLFGGSFGAALPLFGLGLGSSLGGDSGIGKILGGIGGGLLGIGLAGVPAVLASGGALAGSLGFLAPLFSNPITAAIGAAILPAAFLLGKAKQRKKDESLSGDILQSSIDRLKGLRDDVNAGRLDGASAWDQWLSIRSEMIQGFSQIKSKSVRESRLTNQVRDMDNLAQDWLQGAITKQKARSALAGKLVPEFATGGVKRGDGYAFLHDNEIIINTSQQTPAVVKAAAEAGVPGVARPTAGPSAGYGSPVKLEVTIVMGTQDQTEVFLNGIKSPDGYNALVGATKKMARFNDTRGRGV